MFSFIGLTRAATTPRCRGCQTEPSARNAPGSSTNQGFTLPNIQFLFPLGDQVANTQRFRHASNPPHTFSPSQNQPIARVSQSPQPSPTIGGKQLTEQAPQHFTRAKFLKKDSFPPDFSSRNCSQHCLQRSWWYYNCWLASWSFVNKLRIKDKQGPQTEGPVRLCV